MRNHERTIVTALCLLNVVLLTAGCASTKGGPAPAENEDPLKYTKKLVAEGHATLYTNYDETIWNYHDATGLLNNKHYDDGTEVTYTYTSDGKIASRTWARGVTTTYNYYLGQSPDLFTGELKSVDYPGTGDDLTYAYDRMGRITSVTDVTGSRTMDFSDTTLAPTTETFNSGKWFAGTVVTQTYQGSGEGLVSGRWSGVKIGIAGRDDAAYYTALYGYDGLGRLSTVAGPGLPAGGAEYTYLLNGSAQTGLPEKTNFKDGSANVLASAKTTFETTRNLIWKAENLFGAGTSDPISKYEYKNDARARRQGVVYSGAAFGGGFIDDWVVSSLDRSQEPECSLRSVCIKDCNGEIEACRGTFGHRPLEGFPRQSVLLGGQKEGACLFPYLRACVKPEQDTILTYGFLLLAVRQEQVGQVHLVVRAVRVFAGITAEAIDFALSLFLSAERCHFDHAGVFPQPGKHLRTDLLIPFHERLRFIFAPQGHQGAPHVHDCLGIIGSFGKGPSQGLLRLGGLLQRKLGQGHQVEDTDIVRLEPIGGLQVGQRFRSMAQSLQYPGPGEPDRNGIGRQAHCLRQMGE